MEIKNYDEEIDWDKIQNIIDNEFSTRMPFLNTLSMQSIYDVYHNDLKAPNKSVEEIVDLYLVIECEEISISIGELANMYKSDRFINEDKEINSFYTFVKTSTIDINANIIIENGALKSMQLYNQKFTYENNKNAIEYLKGLNIDISSFELQLIFGGEINFVQDHFKKKIEEYMKEKFKWNVEGLRTLCEEIKGVIIKRLSTDDILMSKDQNEE